jgi:electron transport complex, RnfABCDGE type, G subunit
MLGTSISKNSLLLATFALLAAGGLALTNEGTKERIQQAERAAQQKALFEIVPRSRHDNDLLLDTMPIPQDYWATLGLKSGGNIHIARQQGEVVAMIIPAVAPDGYSGDIRMIVGVNRDGSIAGVRVLTHNETPGLGDKVDLKKSDWILSFDGKSLLTPAATAWAVRKDGGEFDQFTGATITPRAVVNQVRRVLEFIEARGEKIALDAQSSTATEPAVESPVLNPQEQHDE